MSNEILPNVPKAQVLRMLDSAFKEVERTIEFGRETAIESQNNQMQSTPVTIHSGAQNVLITLLLLIAKKLGLSEDELEKVFDEVLKLLSTYKAKKGEV